MALSVLVLAGSPVDEFHGDLSRVYAQGFLDVLAGDDACRPMIAWVSPGGAWCFPSGLDAADVAAAPQLSLSEAVEVLTCGDVDVMVPEMFCLPGMTTYRSLFDLIGIPYVGNRADVMALTADKARARAVVAAAGVAVPHGVVVRRGETVDVDVPVVVKPVDADNSAGVSLVRDPSDLDAAVEGALEHSDAALVETFVPLGREVRCGVIERDGGLVCLPLEEYAVADVRTPADKLDRTGDGELYLVAKERTRAWIVPTDDPVTQKVWDMARRCHVALGCRHYSLIDVRIDPDGEPWFLEASLYCSYSPSSVVAVMAAASGVGVDELFAMALDELAVQRPDLDR
ncbi:D-alanine--D-alanine ligase [Aeromicrobium sp. CFBP 8757]|uniref:D-alanine--D-alanine ligase family protein n=1 Tax=Aeromicrobium sp. CFBP 8757 TaxID=2775288 RepID=UPI00178304E7|nr:D-alanine--D-alanine ligase [Aeromicrobium sp. CFBP 8757]MBD8606365.1 D-alanine--D-alanine ligase [Aeromicrobium sp. CFBP 8757]